MMNYRKRAIMWLLMAMLIGGMVSPDTAADRVWAESEHNQPSTLSVLAGEAAVDNTVIGNVPIDESSYMELKDVMLFSGDDEGTAVFTVTVTNGGRSDLNFDEYWLRLRSAAGGTFTVNLLTPEKNGSRVPPGASQEYRFYSKIGSATSLRDLIFQFVRLDFSAAGFETVVGSLSAPADFSFVTQAGKARNISLDGVPVHATISRLTVSESSEYYMATLYLDMMNAGAKGAALPGYTYYIRTRNGLYFPLQTSAFAKDTVLQPLVHKEGTLTGSIPLEAGSDGWHLVLVQPVTASDKSVVHLAAAQLEIPEAGAAEGSIGIDYPFKVNSNSGTYTAKLTSMQRLPWDDQDILVANVTLSSKGAEPLPIPELTGYFRLDDAVTVEAKMITYDKSISLQPGKEIIYQIAGKIPYTSEFQAAKLVLQEKGTNSTANDLLTFLHKEKLMDMPFIPVFESRAWTATGQSSAYRVRAVQTYEGDTSDTVAVQMTVQNLEKRLSAIRKQTAQLISADGTVFPATITDISSKLTPGGSALLNVWATVPKGYDTSGMQVIMGDAITFTAAGAAANAESKQEGYVNAVTFELPPENKVPMTAFADIELYPYSVTLSHIGTQVNFANGTIDLGFNYELKKNALVEADLNEISLIVELKDDLFESGKEIVISQAFSLLGNDASKSLQLGTHDAVIHYTNKDKVYKIYDMKTYQLNVYQQFRGGQKKLLATKELEWFLYNE
jgi:hypothetical protein